MIKPPILTVDGLSRDFIAHGKTVSALNRVSFHLYPSESLGIVGESGCGKSTLARIITQIEMATAGDVFFDGQNILTASHAEKYRIRRQIQMVFQNPQSAISSRMTIGKFLCEAMINYKLVSRNQAKKESEHLLEMVELPKRFMCKYPSELSGGELQRIVIARALSVNPRIIIFDEATSALDVLVRKKILQLLVDLKQSFDLSYIFIGHNLAVVRQVTDRMMVMHQGRIVETLDSEHFKIQAQNDYTLKLIHSIITPDMRMER